MESPFITRSKIFPLVIGLGCGLAWLLIVWWRMSSIPVDFYQNRDDGIITLSHAKNLVDHGFIGVNEAGERVEGYSSPLQFMVFTVFYSLTGSGYSAWILFQVLACSFFLGWIVFLCYREFSENLYWCTAAALLTGWLMMRSYSAFGWHVSGMENCLTHVMYVLCGWIFLRGLKQIRLANWVPGLLFLASLSRFESIFHIGMWTAFFCLLHYLIHRNFQSLKWLLGLGLLWALGMVWHFWYFGDWVPNTAHSQGIDFSKNISNLFHNLKFMVNECARKNFALLFIPAFLIALLSYRDKKFLAGWALVGFPFFIFIVHVLLFATVRLDPARTNTFVTVFAVMTLMLSAVPVRKWKWAPFVPLLIAVSPLPAKYFPAAPYKICCSPLPIEEYRRRFLEVANEEKIFRPFVANPDLGCMTFGKDFHVTDLGMLGSTFFAHYKDPLLWNEYIFRISRPDMIEIHGVWSCFYPQLFADPRWKETYEKLPQYPDSIFRDCADPSFQEAGIFIRKEMRKNSASRERDFHDAMAKSQDLNLLNTKIEELNSGIDSSAANYLPQMIWRFLPEIRNRGETESLESAVKKIKDKNVRDLCQILIRSSRENGFHKKIFSWLKPGKGN